MQDEVRRVVTAQVDDLGRIAVDERSAPIELGGGARVFELWRERDEGGDGWTLNPPANGAVFRIAEFPPATAGEEPYMHLTPTVDYGIVIEGELVLVVDGEERVLKTGDCFVQRSANHGWINRGAVRCRMAVILVDGAAS